MVGDSSDESKGLHALVDLGFTNLEASVYTCLLSNSPMTGYGVAKKLGKPVANTYKAIQSLQAKGAVLVEEGETNLCRAIPVDELLEQMQRRFLERRKVAEANLRELSKAPDDDRVYHLSTVDQVYERARIMLANCKGVAYVDLYPGPLEALRDAIEEAIERGIKVTIQTYAPTEEFKGARMLAGMYQDLLDKWPRQWMGVNTDGSQLMIALLTKNCTDVFHAIWTASPILSWIQLVLMDADALLTQMLPLIRSGHDIEELRAIHNEWKQSTIFKDAYGLRQLIERFGWEEE